MSRLRVFIKKVLYFGLYWLYLSHNKTHNTEHNMRVASLNIEKRESYVSEYPNEIVGIVQIVGSTGKMEVKLSSKTVSAIFNLVKEDVQRVANYNAQQASEAVEEASNQLTIVEQNRALGE